jgi:hypothetical protein
MNRDFLNVSEVIEFTTLSQKQIRNNLNRLSKSKEFENLIYGGGKGKGGRFRFHYSILPIVLLRRRKNKVDSTLKSRKVSEFYYSKCSWDYFGCIQPNKELDYLELIDSLENFDSFYVIHRRNEKNHIHFTIHSSLSSDEIKDQLNLYFKNKRISIDEVFLTRFDKGFKDDTINYLLRRGKHNSKNDLIDWGLSFNFQKHQLPH